MRGLVGSENAAERTRELAHGRVPAAAPDLLYAEVVNALVQYVRTARLSTQAASDALDYVTSLPLEVSPCKELASDALGIALARGVSAYDAMYLVLAEATDGVLVTADRRLAETAARAELLDD